MTQPITAQCKKDHFPAFRSSGSRPLSAIKWVVLHSTEGGTAESVARYFKSSTAQGSTHLVVDDKECQRCLPNTAVPWGASGANFAGIHIEQCGFAKWSLVIWRSHLKTLQRAAFKTALHCHWYGIPIVFREAADLKAGKPGITTHKECSRAFGGTHWDPGPGWPRPLFMALVRAYSDDLTLTDPTDE